MPDVRFFHLTSFEIAGRRVDALRHGMAGQPGSELFGPWADGARVHAAPLPAISTGDELAAYREWLPAARAGSLAGSYVPEAISGYYLRPHELGYGKVIAFDHEFVGRTALEGLDTEPLRRRRRRQG